jgi:hypothetical protein
MNLGSLLDFMGTLLDYDPSNSTYRAQVVTLLNDAQVRCLTDRHWDFSTRDRKMQVWTDTTLTLNVTSGTATATGTGFPVSTDLVKPGSELARAEVTFTDSAGTPHKHRIAWVENGTTLYLDRIYRGTSGAVSALVKRRDVFLPSDSMNVLNVADPSVGVPAKALMLSKWEREDANLDADLLGTVEAYVPSEGVLVRAPQMVRGVTVVGASAGQGARTVDVYMVNVSGPNAQNYPAYRSDVSSGFESAFSKVSSFTLSDTQTLNFTPETIPNHTGLYRRYYFTCSEAGIIAPVRVRNADAEGGAIIDRDTINTKGGITLKPDLALSTLQGQAFHSTSIRYRFNQSSAYRSIQLYPHPAENQKLDVRVSINPARMQEDQDATLIPASYSKMLAYSALEKLALKVDGASALAVAYSRERAVLYKGMEARFLAQVPRRIIKGSPTAGHRFVRNPYGKLTFS